MLAIQDPMPGGLFYDPPTRRLPLLPIDLIGRKTQGLGMIQYGLKVHDEEWEVSEGRLLLKTKVQDGIIVRKIGEHGIEPIRPLLPDLTGTVYNIFGTG